MSRPTKRYFLPYELDAFGNVPNIARSAGIPAADVAYGNLLMWQHVWRTKSDLVTTAHIQAFFGANACEALVLFGHLEASETGWRVKGAAEWLRVMTAQSRAGKAKAGNLIPGGPKALGSPSAYAPKRTEAEAKPVGSPSALPATSHQPPATSDHEKTLRAKKPPAPPKPEKPADPRHAPLVKALVDASPGLGFGPRDARHVTELLAKGEPDEVLRRWRRALSRSGYPTVRTLSELVTHWPHFATEGPQGFDPNQGIISSRSAPPPSKPINLDEPVELPF